MSGKSLLTLVILLAMTAACTTDAQRSPSPQATEGTPAGASSLEAPDPSGTPTATILKTQLDEYLTRLAALGFSGVVLVARGDEVIQEQGYGGLDHSGAEPMTPDTVFAIGSNTKPITAAAILKLQDQGRLSVDDPLTRFLPGVPADKAGITLHQLLTHSAGLNHSGFFDGDLEPVDGDEAVRRILQSKLLFAPGAESSYSDADYILLAAIVEQASGKIYQDFVRTELLEPAGMTSTGWWGMDPTLCDVPKAIGYVDGEARGTVASLPGPYWAIMGAGGMVSSVADLYRWHRAVQSGAILSPASVAAYASVQFPLDDQGGEGYGWMVVTVEQNRRVRTSAGGTPQLGHNNVMTWWMDDDLLFIASSNNAAFRAEDVVPHLRRIVFGQDYRLPPQIAAVEPAVLASYAGRYRLSGGGALVVTADRDRLVVAPEGQIAFELLYPQELAGPGNQPQDVAARQAAALNFLEHGGDARIEAWRVGLTARLGDFKRFTLMGTATPDGGEELWTYVALEYERGSALVRLIVTPEGAMQAILLDAEPPAMTLVPQSSTEFVSFGLGATPAVNSVRFTTDNTGAVTLHVTSARGEMVAERE